MRGLAIMEHKTIRWTDPPTTQHVHSLDVALLHGHPYRSRRHTVVTAGFTAQQLWWAVCNWVPQT